MHGKLVGRWCRDVVDKSSATWSVVRARRENLQLNVSPGDRGGADRAWDRRTGAPGQKLRCTNESVTVFVTNASFCITLPMALALRNLGLLAASARRTSFASRPGRGFTRTSVRTFAAAGGAGESRVLSFVQPQFARCRG